MTGSAGHSRGLTRQARAVPAGWSLCPHVLTTVDVPPGLTQCIAESEKEAGRVRVGGGHPRRKARTACAGDRISLPWRMIAGPVQSH